MRGILKGGSKKVILIIIAVFFVLSNFYFLTSYGVKDANAVGLQAVIDPLSASIQIPWKGLEIAQISLDEILNDLKATFFKNVVANLSRSFAKSYTQFIVTGSKGGKPFWETNVWDSIKNQGNAAFEDWLTAAISNGIGLDLCKFDPTLTLNLALTLPNKPDKSAKIKEKTVLGNDAATGCSFQDLKDKFSNDSPEWQDYIKIKVTSIGPDFRQTIDQLSRDISQNKNLRDNNAQAPNFPNPPTPLVLSDLTNQTNALGNMRNELDADMTIMIDKRGTTDPVQLSVGPYILAPEYINEIKAAWVKKIGDGRTLANTQKAAYRACYNKDITAIRLDPCDKILNNLGYNPVPGQLWVNAHNASPADQAGQFVREVQAKLETSYNYYNSLANGYEGLYQFINTQIKPEMFQSGGLYTYQKAKTQFQPQADPATQTQQQVEAGTAKAQTDAEERKKTEVSTTGGWKNSVETISGYIKTPASLLQAKTIESLSKGDSVGTYTKSIVADSLGIFLQELYNLYINQLLLSLSNPKKQQSTNDGNTFNAEKQSMVTEEGVNRYYDSLSQDSTITLPDLDLLQEFQTTINAKKINPNIYNNVIDLNFAMAINQRLTIGQALASGQLKGTYGFSGAETLEANKYNLSNIKKLRKARVVPLGLELAAELISDCNYKLFGDISDPPTPYDTQRLTNCPYVDTPDNQQLTNIANATLQNVIDGFGLRGTDGICGNADAGESPFCNLVDPDWVLKIPATKCLQASSAEAYGEILQDNNTGSRYARCADFISCLTDDTAKSCGSADYGVCVKEKNVWRMGADTCPAQYDSCRIYTSTDSKGAKSKVAFLKNTLDSSTCGPDNVGCKAYQRGYDDATIYFNRNVQTCEANVEGCHEFITDQDTLNNLIGTSTLPTAYDDNVLASRVYYKINPACEINPAGANCSGFMTKCSASEVGCASFKPVSGAPAVTAVLNQDDQCSSECNGFSAFFRQPTSFEPDSQLAYFVSSTAKVCTAAAAGCSEFTNLEKVNSGTPSAEALEYYTSLRQCIKPGSGLNEKTFFTWQSIASGPQQVIKHLLQAADDGSPKTINGSLDCTGDIAVGNYCLKFYGIDGQTYYRDIRQTIIVSETGCFPLRKTNSNQVTCTATNGTWDTANNYCTYNAYAPSAQEAASAGFGETSQKCAAAENGCYNYLAASGNNVYNVFYDNFPSGTVFPSEYSGTGLSISSESLIAASVSGHEEHSLAINAGGQAVRTIDIAGGKYYVLDFLAKDDCKDASGNATAPGAIDIAGFGRVNLNCTWDTYELGPIKIDSNLNNLTFSNQSSATIFIDNVNLVQYKANYYLLENSWQQVGCGIEDLNCEAYTGPNEQTFYIKQFSNLCGSDKVGCQYLLDTQNSLNPQSQDFSGLIVPADNLTSYVVNSNFKCTSASKGCEKFSEPTYQAGTGVVYDNVILKNDPDAYLGARGILCAAGAQGCTELTNENGAPEYYKIDPAKICQYENSGWYLTDSEGTTKCNPADASSILKTTDSGYNGATGVCPLTAGNCTGFQTVNQNVAIDTTKATEVACSSAQPNNNLWQDGKCFKDYFGYTYYLIDDENNIDRASCTAGTDWTKGCVAFKNTVNNEVQTIKVTKDRDCDQWVKCTDKDNVGNCTQMTLFGSDGQPAVQSDNVRYSPSADPLAGNPLIINRLTYIKRFADAKDIWNMGDYSGYTIPDRYPLETELTSLIVSGKDVSNFNTYPKEVDSANGIDPRFSAPVCKIFPAQDSPVPIEIVYQLGYNKILNVYSQSVSAADVADGCNYITADAAGVTTYFPYGFLQSALGAQSPRICTGKTSLNGKLCQNKENDKQPNQCKTFAVDTTTDEDVQSSAYGQCLGVENQTTNFGLQSRCLEMDLLNPLYGNITPGSYACLSYFPFQFDECKVVSTDENACKKLPNCNWLPGTPTGECVSDICAAKHDKVGCETVKEEDDKTNSCLWDAVEKKCLFRTCSLSTVNSQRTCEGLAKYCKWYGNTKTAGHCVEDICSAPYSNLGSLGIDSHPEPDADLCMNPDTLTAFADLSSPASLYNPNVLGNGNYCAWQARTDTNKNGRWQFDCQLKCDLKYPNSNYTAACARDSFCKWATSSCANTCDAGTSSDSCNSIKCTWDSSAVTCKSKCLGLSTQGASGTPVTFTTSQCGDTADADALDCVQNGNYACADACTGKDAATCVKNSACVYNSGACVNVCRTLTNLQCNSASYSSHCKVNNNGKCVLRDPFVCTAGNLDVLNSTAKANTCTARWGCEIKYPACKLQTFNCSNKTEANCNAAVLNGNCSWISGGCVDRNELGNCALHEYAVSPENLNDYGASCRAAGCNWLRYTYSHYDKNIGCFPSNYTGQCYECVAVPNSNGGCGQPGC